MRRNLEAAACEALKGVPDREGQCQVPGLEHWGWGCCLEGEEGRKEEQDEFRELGRTGGGHSLEFILDVEDTWEGPQQESEALCLAFISLAAGSSMAANSPHLPLQTV